MNHKSNIKQHFLPQCYLKNFSPNGKNIYIYDKGEKKSFRNSIDNIGYLNYFYDIPLKYIKNKRELPYDTKFYEKGFFAENVEKTYSKILEKINQKADDWILTQKQEEILNLEEREIFAQLMAIQHLRMPNIIEDVSDSYEKTAQEAFEIIKSGINNMNPDLEKMSPEPQIKYDKDFDSILHAKIYTNDNLISGIANEILNKYWVFYVSKQNDFFTSDNPIVINPHIANQHNYHDGFGMKGAEIIFPIGKSAILTLWDSGYFTEKDKKDNTFCFVKQKEKRAYNLRQYIWSNRQTYSYLNNFNIIKLLKADNGGEEIIMKRPRTIVNGK